MCQGYRHERLDLMLFYTLYLSNGQNGQSKYDMDRMPQQQFSKHQRYVVRFSRHGCKMNRLQDF